MNLWDCPQLTAEKRHRIWADGLASRPTGNEEERRKRMAQLRYADDKIRSPLSVALGDKQ